MGAAAAPRAPGSQGRAGLDLYWVPLGAGASVVRVCGKTYEALTAFAHRRSRRDLYHSALIATIDGHEHVVEMTPVLDDAGPLRRGVVGEGAVGMRWTGRFRIFRYEIRRWKDGVLADRHFAVSSPVHLTNDQTCVTRLLDLVSLVPRPVWGRDELEAGEMWNSNSVVSWLLTQTDVLAEAGTPPAGGRAPGWDAGVRIASRSDHLLPPVLQREPVIDSGGPPRT